MKKNIIFSIIISLTLVLSAHAQTTSSTPTIEELQKQIQLLLSQMSSLQKEVTTLRSTTPAPTTTSNMTTSTTATTPIVTPSITPLEIDESEVTETETAYVLPPVLTRSLFRGSRGEDVRQLQEFLAQDPTIYPDGAVSGYYGVSTEAAVKRWQAKNGIPSVGIIGRQTIAKFKVLYPDATIFPRPTAPVPNDSTIVTRPSYCPVYSYMPVCKENQSSFDQKGCQVCQQKTPEVKKEICPALPTVDACPAGEERVVTYKSESCGVYYACKSREISRADNTVATLKKVSSIQTDNRYTINLYDPEGVQKFSLYNSKGTEINLGYPACRKEWSSPIISVNAGEFPLKLSLADCASSQYSTTLNTSVVIKPILEGLTFPYKFSSGKIVSSSEEARSYCYANGPSSGQGTAAECETKFGVVYTNITTVATTSGRAVYLTDSFAACMTKYGFSAEAKQIKTWAQSPDSIPWSTLSSSAQNTVQKCESEYYGQQTVETGAAMCADGKDNDGDGFIDSTDPSCTGYTSTSSTTQSQTLTQNTTTASNSNWINKTWNFRDGQSATSYILNRTDAEYANYLAPIQAQCLTINKSLFTWKPNAGSDATTNWQNFGIPDCSETATSSTNTQTTTTVTYPSSGQKNQIWNSLGLNSSIRTDADPTRIDSLKQACVSTPSGANIWSPNAGTSSSVDFGMPSADKCQRASACTTSQYFDGANCVSSTYQTTSTYSSCPTDVTNLLGSGCHEMNSSYYFNGAMDRYVIKSAATIVKECSTNYVQGCTTGTTSTTSTTTTDSCSQYGDGWHVMGDNNCYDSSMTNYRTANGTLYSCSSTPSSGCSSSGNTTTSSSCGSGYYWNGSSCVSSSSSTTGCGSSPGACTTESQCTAVNFFWYDSSCHSSSSSSSNSSTACSSSQYWNGSSCVSSSSTTSTSCPSGQYWSGTACVISTTSSSCSSGQYWNGSACVNTSTTDCTSGQYWNGTACVSSTPSASVYDQMRDQLKSMEIILRDLLKR